MSRQHVTPLLLSEGAGSAVPLVPLGLTGGAEAVSEAAIQRLVHLHPACLPIAEIDPMFLGPVPICTELNTPAGPIDNFLVTPSGLPVLVECKLWRNPEGRREVVGQILDYAKELSRWSSSDLQREVSRRLGSGGNLLLDLVRKAGHEVDEIEFNDALTLNLRRGRFLLLIVGDGIREGVEAITEYLQIHAGLHFTFGLVELPFYSLPTGEKLVVPRILARTILIGREVIAAPEGYVVRDTALSDPEETDSLTDEEISRRDFMREVISDLTLEDPDQPPPRVTPKGWLFLYMPAPASSCWVGVLFKKGGQEVGVRLTSNIGTVGEAAIRVAVRDWDELREQLGGDPELEEMAPDRYRVQEYLRVAPGQRERAVAWARERLGSFVSVFRPRIRAAVDQLKDQS